MAPARLPYPAAQLASEKLFRLSQAMERTVKDEKGLIANAGLLSGFHRIMLGIPVVT